MVCLIQREASLYQSLKTVDKQLNILSITVGLGEEPSKPPQPSKATALEIKVFKDGQGRRLYY